MIRRVAVTVYRGKSHEVIWRRQYSYFDTAMARTVQLLLTYGQTGDFAVLHSTEVGFDLGTVKMTHAGRYGVTMSPLVKSSPALMKLVQEQPL